MKPNSGARSRPWNVVARQKFRDEDDLPDVPVRAAQSDGLEMRDLASSLGRLPAEQRGVLLLVGLEELRYAEAARALGIPQGTVLSRLSRARSRLQSILNGEAVPQLKVVKT